MKPTCIQIAEAAGLVFGRMTAKEQLCICQNHADHNPTLSINSEKDVFNCPACNVGGNWWKFAAFLAGVSPEDKIAVSRWLREHGLSGGNATNSIVGANKRIIAAAYQYTDEHGKLLFEAVRYQPKGFGQRRPDGKGGWIWNVDGVRRVLYRLPELIRADADEVYITEGEKCADAVRELGLVATTAPMGAAAKWLPEYSASFKPRHRVVLLPDNDAPGKTHMQKVAKELYGKIGSLKILELPNLPPKGDVVDWLRGRGRENAAEVISLFAEVCEEWKPGEQTMPSQPEPKPESIWDAAQTAEDFVKLEEDEVEFLYKPLLVPGAITEVFSPRGIGKTHAMIAVIKNLSERGKRVLLLDRDNPPKEVRRRLRLWGATSPNLKVMTRENVPPLTDAAAWHAFPFSDYDVVVIDSLDSSAEGVGEGDSAKPAKAIAVVLDIAHRPDGPAILVLGNTIKSGAHSRGSGIVEDRADIVFEVRDATGLKPTGQKPWHEELPPAGAGDWASKATRRKQKDVYNLAFIPTKFRTGEEPDPFIYELNLIHAPWQMRDVTADVVEAGDAAKDDLRRIAAVLEAGAVSTLKAAIATSEFTSTEAAKFLTNHCGIQSRKVAREIIERQDGRDWNLVRHIDRPGKPFILTAIQTGKNETTAEMPSSQKQQPVGVPDAPIYADSHGIDRRKCPDVKTNPVHDPSVGTICAVETNTDVNDEKRI